MTRKSKSKDYYQTAALGLFGVVVLWVVLTTIMQAVQCPEMTQTQLLLRTFKSITLNFQAC